ncbi:MAG: murein transglycosylase [Nostocales cyanobacterium]|nr:MAG: murein transglycosylase [Nostocales cyanobacterium]TAF14567.1 MAG: murein transglycosylase [Nostocales cyanobacterium]
MKRILNTTFSLPFFFTIFLLEMPVIQDKNPVVSDCKITKWDLPNDLKTENPNQNPQQLTTLVKRDPVGCCEKDASCLDHRIYGSETEKVADKKALINSIDQSLRYLRTGRADSAYQRYKYRYMGINKNRVYRSLKRFRELVLSTNSPQELQAAIEKEFVYYQSIGNDEKGTVLFTAYYEPVYVASRKQTKEFKYPVYRLPPNIRSWSKPHPTRIELEGADGLQGDKGKLKGLELFWFRDRFEPYMIQVQGSGRLKLTDGKETSIGYAGNTAHNYKSLGKMLVADGKLPKDGVTMPTILEYFAKNPQDLNYYIPQNNSFVFFTETHGRKPQGSISVPLTPERSIATDKSLMPPGALALIRAPFPFLNKEGKLEHQTVSRFVLDQDTGGAIKGAGRVDYYLGSGKIAGDRAGITVNNGQLFYLLLKN